MPLETQNTEHVQQLLAQSIRVGVVTELDPDKATVRCKFNDSDGLTSYWLRVLHHKTHQDKSYWMPDVGEQVLCICLPHGQEQGFVLGAFYSEIDKCEEFSSPDKDHKQYKDGTWHQYDREEHKQHGDILGILEYFIRKYVHIQVDKGVIIYIKGDLTIGVEGDVIIRSDKHLTVTAGKCITHHCDRHGEGTM